MTPMRTFHVRPERGSRLSIRVEVFRTVGEFRQAVRDEDYRAGFKRAGRTRGLVACCTGVTVWNVRRRRRTHKTGLFAVLRFPQCELVMGTITHEAFHATMRWAARRRITELSTDKLSTSISRNVGSLEERCATVHGNICAQVVRQCRRFNLLPV